MSSMEITRGEDTRECKPPILTKSEKNASGAGKGDRIPFDVESNRNYRSNDAYWENTTFAKKQRAKLKAKK
jgi:hypothetical protein